MILYTKITLMWPGSIEHCEHCSYRSNFLTSEGKWFAGNCRVQHFGIRHCIWRRLLCEGEIWPAIRQESIRIKTSQKIMKTTWTNVGTKHMLRLNLLFFFLWHLQLFCCVSYENTHKQYYYDTEEMKESENQMKFSSSMFKWEGYWECSPDYKQFSFTSWKQDFRIISFLHTDLSSSVFPFCSFCAGTGQLVTSQGSLSILDSKPSGGSGRKYLFLCITTSLWSSVITES